MTTTNDGHIQINELYPFDMDFWFGGYCETHTNRQRPMETDFIVPFPTITPEMREYEELRQKIGSIIDTSDILMDFGDYEGAKSYLEKLKGLNLLPDEVEESDSFAGNAFIFNDIPLKAHVEHGKIVKMESETFIIPGEPGSSIVIKLSGDNKAFSVDYPKSKPKKVISWPNVFIH